MRFILLQYVFKKSLYILLPPMIHSSSYFSDSQNEIASFIEGNAWQSGAVGKCKVEELEIIILVLFFNGLLFSGILHQVFLPMSTALFPDPVVRFENRAISPFK
jgi:hypothetical protein